ncbi:YbaN family protein [Roseovarius aestuarii]|uniref:Inner membrane protein YbaN n=1 Tax=Roseovarius aestuarii TaxID=475083 RepID=A0A1X7BR00_9RHOB|nr:YbaN family protein [Roseovarius aestuarii]SMC12004.1 Inner membrane protein YbaN [Roseovarius aestuarii]
MRLLWVTLGLLSLGLGIIGIAVPLLPTVPFVLLAAFCFARSSERLHNWLLTHPRFGPVIEDWNQNGAISPRIKRISTLSILAVFGISLVMGLRPVILIVQAITLGCVTVFIWTRPNG